MANKQGIINSVSVHSVGNKANEDPLFISELPLHISDELMPSLENYFNPAFKTEKYFRFFSGADPLDSNTVYKTVKKAFADPQTLYEASCDFSRKLYNAQNHPNIKGGEFYTVYFEECLHNGDTVDAIGLFKSENKEAYLKIGRSKEAVTLKPGEGVNIKNLDKGCLIFNTESEDGYVVAVVDKTNGSEEARFWIDDFLGLREKDDAYHKTEHALSLCRDFINEALPAEFEVSKADQADLLNRSASFFKSHSNFDVEAFSDEVIEQPEVIEKFKDYRTQFENQTGLQVEDRFDISAPAVKRNNKVFKSIIKLDKNFHIYVHGNSNLIERGAEADGRKYYKVYFDEEK